MSVQRRRAKAARREAEYRQHGAGRTHRCVRCGEPGSHFVPPSLGDIGFFICDPPADIRNLTRQQVAAAASPAGYLSELFANLPMPTAPRGGIRYEERPAERCIDCDAKVTREGEWTMYDPVLRRSFRPYCTPCGSKYDRVERTVRP